MNLLNYCAFLNTRLLIRIKQCEPNTIVNLVNLVAEPVIQFHIWWSIVTSHCDAISGTGSRLYIFGWSAAWSDAEPAHSDEEKLK